MMKELMKIHQPNQSPLDNNQENMSNVTSAASGEAASVSSCNGGVVYPQHYFGSSNTISQPSQPQQIKKKRNQPGNPDPDAEVIALSPKSLMATNRFVCEICNKGFQRDQNLQLHRRGHNLPWKLKQRSSKDIVRKKVYVCPENSCVHHDPSRALGDLTGIKKHFCRKHGEKKWKCEKCSKRYAVHSDWKAHSKTCGTREYRCDCGTLFSRRDSFITHRAFCDALAEESGRAVSRPYSHAPPLPNYFEQPPVFSTSHSLSAAAAGYSVKKENAHAHQYSSNITAGFNLRQEIPPWLLAGPSPAVDVNPSFFQEFQNPNHALPGDFGSPHFSATALLQKAAQMGATMSGKTGLVGPAVVATGAHTTHVSSSAADQTLNNNSLADFGLNLSSSSRGAGLLNGSLASFVGKGNLSASAPSAPSTPPVGSFFHDMMMNTCFSSSTNPITFEDYPLFGGGTGGGFLNNSPKKEGNHEDVTKDFLGLRRSDIFGINDLVHTSSTSDHHQGQSQNTWQQT